MKSADFAATLADALWGHAKVGLSSKDRAIALARDVIARNGDMMLTAPEAELMAREFLAALHLPK